MGASSAPEWLTESGYVFGISDRYSPGDTSKESSGYSTWLYDAHVGTHDAARLLRHRPHREPTATSGSRVLAANESGYALGTSDRYGGANRW